MRKARGVDTLNHFTYTALVECAKNSLNSLKMCLAVPCYKTAKTNNKEAEMKARQKLRLLRLKLPTTINS